MVWHFKKITLVFLCFIGTEALSKHRSAGCINSTELDAHHHCEHQMCQDLKDEKYPRYYLKGIKIKMNGSCPSEKECICHLKHRKSMKAEAVESEISSLLNLE